MTGIRVSNLKNITYGHIQRLLNKEDITITLIKTKKGSVQQTFPWQGTYSKIISHIEKDLKYLIDFQKEGNGPFDISREHLNRSLNKVLIEATQQTKKYMRTHSFRIHLADQIIQTKGIFAAQQILGHTSIGSERSARDGY